MRVRVSEPSLRRKLLAFLAFDANAIVTPVGDNEIEISFLGSLNTGAQRMELELRLRAWLAAHPDADAVIAE